MDHKPDTPDTSRRLGQRASISRDRGPRGPATLFKNTVAQSGAVLLGFLLSFILAPILIARVGLSAFGVWAVTGAFATYAGLLDLGVSRSLTRFIALYDAQGDEESIRECVGLGLIAVTVVGALAAIAAGVGAPLASDKLGVLSSGEMRVVLLSSVAIWTFKSYGYVLGAVGDGLRRMLPPNVAGMIGSAINFAFSIGALSASSNLVIYALANAAASVVALGPAAAALAYLWQPPYVAVPSRSIVREVLGFSLKNQISFLADLVNFQTDKVVIALLVDVRAAAAFEVAGRVILAAQSVAMLATSAMLPTLTAAIAQHGRHVVSGLYRTYTLRSCSLAFPVFAVTAVGAPFLLMAWVGRIPGEGHLVVSYLTLAYVVHITTGVASAIAFGAGHPGIVSTNSTLIALLNVTLTVMLAPLFGFWGVVAGTFLALSMGSLMFVARFHRLFSLPWQDYTSAVLPPGALAFGLAVPFIVLDIFTHAPASRPPAAAALLAVAATYGLAYWIAASRLGFLPSRLTFPLRRRCTIAHVQS
jgi:O-antigen/teichoic acid export membrane protein